MIDLVKKTLLGVTEEHLGMLERKENGLAANLCNSMLRILMIMGGGCPQREASVHTLLAGVSDFSFQI